MITLGLWRYLRTSVTVPTDTVPVPVPWTTVCRYSNGQRFCEEWLYSIWRHKPNNHTHNNRQRGHTGNVDIVRGHFTRGGIFSRICRAGIDSENRVGSGSAIFPKSLIFSRGVGFSSSRRAWPRAPCSPLLSWHPMV